ncbi:DsrE family protein [bacterium]|nr:DsrE family protein [bacterium]
MRQVAYIIKGTATQELVGGCLLNTVAAGIHGRHVTALHFCEDGVYFLLRGTESAAKIERAIREQGVKVTVCECSQEARDMTDKMIDGVTIGHFADFYEAAGEADVVAI